MRKSVSLLIVPAVLVAAACGRDNSKPVDDALRNDLALASAMYQPQQVVSPMEQGYGYPQYGQPVRQYQTGGYYYPTPATARPAPRARSAGTYSTGASRPAARTTVVKHTKRDAAIGAVAGAVIGASTSRDKVKGGLIGAAAGGILGGIIGHTVDVER